MIVYLAVNRVNRKAYVGQTAHSIRRRISGHLRGSYPFAKEVQEYGPESFDWAVLGKCSSREELHREEKRWIKELGCEYPNGYNYSEGGQGGVPGVKKPYVTLRLLGKNGLQHPAYGKRWVYSPEMRAMYSRVQNRPELREANRRRAPLHNPLCNPLTRESALDKLRDAAKKQWADPVRRAAMVDGLKRAWIRRKAKKGDA